MSTFLISAGISAFGALLLASAVGKVDSAREWWSFSAALAPWRPAALLLAVGLPLLELAVVLVLVTSPHLGFVLGCTLLAMLALGAFAAFHRLGAVHCTCFGSSHSSRLGWRVIVRNTLLAGAAAVFAFVLTGSDFAQHSHVRLILSVATLAIMILVSPGLRHLRRPLEVQS